MQWGQYLALANCPACGRNRWNRWRPPPGLLGLRAHGGAMPSGTGTPHKVVLVARQPADRGSVCPMCSRAARCVACASCPRCGRERRSGWRPPPGHPGAGMRGGAVGALRPMGLSSSGFTYWGSKVRPSDRQRHFCWVEHLVFPKVLTWTCQLSEFEHDP